MLSVAKIFKEFNAKKTLYWSPNVIRISKYLCEQEFSLIKERQIKN
jgi:hypothetical protein